MKKILLCLVLCGGSCVAGELGTPNAMVWGGMPYGNPNMWNRQLHHMSNGPAKTSWGRSDPNIDDPNLQYHNHQLQQIRAYYERKARIEQDNYLRRIYQQQQRAN